MSDITTTVDDPIITVSDEQYAYNREVCESCGNPRFIHVQAILCTETEPSNQELLLEIQEVKATVLRIATFIDTLEQAVMSHPLARQMFGG